MERTMPNNQNKNLNKNATKVQQNEGLAHKLGDAIEKVGTKISNAGAPKIGQAIHDLGDKLEHSQDKKRN